jgi:hypothetical protein
MIKSYIFFNKFITDTEWDKFLETKIKFKAYSNYIFVDINACGYKCRQVFQDGQENQIETRHSVSLCLFFCPIGILSHVITKAMTKTTKENKHGL